MVMIYVSKEVDEWLRVNDNAPNDTLKILLRLFKADVVDIQADKIRDEEIDTWQGL